MPKRLNGSTGTGKKIMQNIDIFNYTYDGCEPSGNNTLHKFNWTFGNQSGYASITLTPEGTIDPSSLMNCAVNQSDFRRPLGAYNDNTLYDVFRKMLQSQNISYK